MGSKAARLHRWDEIALEKVTELLSRKIVSGDREMIVPIYVKRGCLVPMHAHESEQMTYVLQGALRFLVGGEEITVREGDVLHIPSGVEHQAECGERRGAHMNGGGIGSKARRLCERPVSREPGSAFS
jgi:quercetin dioxygenase-like cupin family protein